MKKLAMIGGTLVGTAIVIAVIFGTLIYLGYSIPNPFTPVPENKTELSVVPIITVVGSNGEETIIDISRLSPLSVVTIGGQNVIYSVKFSWNLTASATIDATSASGTWSESSSETVKKGSTVLGTASSNTTNWNLGSTVTLTSFVTLTKAQLVALGIGTHTLTASISGTATVSTTSPETMTGTQTYTSSIDVTVVVTASTLSIIVSPSGSSIVT